jgi:hypothetical protein
MQEIKTHDCEICGNTDVSVTLEHQQIIGFTPPNVVQTVTCVYCGTTIQGEQGIHLWNTLMRTLKNERLNDDKMP